MWGLPAPSPFLPSVQGAGLVYRLAGPALASRRMRWSVVHGHLRSAAVLAAARDPGGRDAPSGRDAPGGRDAPSGRIAAGLGESLVATETV